jgi:hypothetical protein
MADAHGSGPCVRKDVGVQLPPCPPVARALPPGFDCTSSYETPTPDVWSCKNGKKLYKTNDEYCGFFKDSGYTGKDTGSK